MHKEKNRKGANRNLGELARRRQIKRFPVVCRKPAMAESASAVVTARICNALLI